MGMTIKEASVNINNPNLITAIKSAIVCTNTKDTYSSGFRNGLRYVIALITDEEPKYEDAPKQNDAISLLKEQEPVEPKCALGVLPDWYHCGVCGMDMLDTGDGYRPKYCPQCGRAVKWE